MPVGFVDPAACLGEEGHERLADLLGTPGLRPTPISAAAMATPDEAHHRARHQLAARPRDLPSEAVGHIGAQLVVGSELGDLRATGVPLGVPLRRRRPILQPIRARGRVAARLTRDRRRRPPQPSRDLTHPCALGTQDRDLLTLREAQISARHRSQTDRWHPSSLTEPPRPDRLRHPGHTGRVLARHPASDRPPEPDPILAPRRRGPPRRPHLRRSLMMGCLRAGPGVRRSKGDGLALFRSVCVRREVPSRISSLLQPGQQDHGFPGDGGGLPQQDRRRL